MDKDQNNWTNFLHNKKAIIGTFSGGYPQFESVQLAQLIISELGAVHVSFNLPSLPKDSPARWIMKNYDRLQLRFTFSDVIKFSVCGQAIEPGLDVIASFDANGLFRISSEEIQVELRSELVKLDLYPYNSDIFEEPRAWFQKRSGGA